MNTDEIVRDMAAELRQWNFRWEMVQVSQGVWMVKIVNANDVTIAHGSGTNLNEAVTNTSLAYLNQRP